RRRRPPRARGWPCRWRATGRRPRARRPSSAAAATTREVTPVLVTVERDEPIAVVLLNRPQQLNALSDELMDDLVTALQELDGDESIRCVVLGGNERAFAAGADSGRSEEHTSE